MKRLFLLVLTVALSFGCSKKSGPEGATARCRDGTYSYSEHRQGTCSHHGGVAEWGPFAGSPTPTPATEIASVATPVTTPTPTPEIPVVTPTPTPIPTPTPTATPLPDISDLVDPPSPAPTPAEVYLADIAEYPGWEKVFEGKDYVYFHKPSEADPVYHDRARMWVRLVVKGPPERVRRQVADDLRTQGLSSAGYDRYTETLDYLSFDCRNKSYHRLSSTDYDGDGNQLYTAREEYSFTYVVPDTIGAKLFDVACKEQVTQSEPPPYTSPTPATRNRFIAPQTAGDSVPVPPVFNIPPPAYTPPVAENGSYYGEISPRTGRPKTVHVDSYYRSDGTYVRGHYRSAPVRGH